MKDTERPKRPITAQPQKPAADLKQVEAALDKSSDPELVNRAIKLVDKEFLEGRGRAKPGFLRRHVIASRSGHKENPRIPAR